MSEGILRDSRMPRKLDIDKLVDSGDWCRMLLEDIKISYKKCRAAWREGKEVEEWDTVVNLGYKKENKYTEKKEGRFISTNLGVMKAMEQNENWVEASKLRAYLDVRVSQTSAAMKVWNNFGGVVPQMYVPKTGGRFMGTSENCPRHMLHTDFLVHKRSEEELEAKCPGYFGMCTEEDEDGT